MAENFSEQTVHKTKKEGTPTNDELQELGNEIATDWVKLGRRLGVSDPNIEEINKAHDQLSEKGYHVLKHWKQEKGSAATYQALCEALQHTLVQRKDLAEKFCYINAPADPVPEGTVTGTVSGAASSTSDSRHSTGVRSAQKRKGVERGVLPWKIHCVSATSRYSGEQDPQEQSEIVNNYMAQKIDEVIMEGIFDLSSFEGLEHFYVYLCGHLSLVGIKIQKGSIKITVKCRTLEILECLWDDYCSGRLNAEAEKCLITENVKERLGMETIKLATTILEEDYLACKFSLKETAGSSGDMALSLKAMATYKHRLQKYYQVILRDLEPRRLVNILYQEEVFDDDDMEEVICEMRKKQAEVLLEKVKRLEDSKVAIVVDSLRQTQQHLYELLQTPGLGEEALRQSQVQASLGPRMGDLTSGITGLHIYQETPPCVPKALGPTATEHAPQLGNTETSAVYSQSSDDHLNPPPGDEVTPFVIPTDLAKIPPHNRPDSHMVYPMRSKPRGITLIINNEVFNHSLESTEKEQQQEELNVRYGSEKDVAALEQLFGALDFKVRTARNKGRREILKLLDEVSHYDHKDYDCFVLWLMSHGQEGQFYGADGNTVPIETVRDFFSNARCSTLKGKPKIIFIEASRGREKEHGVVADAPPSPTKHGKEPTTHEDHEDHEDEENSDISFNFKCKETIPINADMLIANATISGYASFRNPRSGSRFVRCIVEVFREYACHEDLLSMLTMVNQRIGKMGEIDTKQVAEPAYTLTKKLFFWPGL